MDACREATDGFETVMVLAFTALVAGALAVTAAHQRTAPGSSTIADAAGVSGAGRQVVARFVERSHRFRRTGTVVGFTAATAVWLVHQVATEPESQTVGLGAVAAVGLVGSLGGTVAAEAFRLRRHPGAARTASLRPRDSSFFEDRVTTVRERIVAVIAIVAVGLSVASGTLIGAALAALALLLLALRRWAQRRIVTRPRPALPPDLGHADDVVRRLAAIHAIGRPATTAACLVLSVAFSCIGAESGVFGAGLASLALLVVGSVWWWSGAHYGETARRPTATAIVGGLVAATLIAMLATILVARGST